MSTDDEATGSTETEDERVVRECRSWIRVNCPARFADDVYSHLLDGVRKYVTDHPDIGCDPGRLRGLVRQIGRRMVSRVSLGSPPTQQPVEEIAARGSTPAEEVEEQDLKEALDRAIESLPTPHRRVMRDYKRGKPVAAIAEELRLSERRVYGIVAEAVEKLSKRLGDRFLDQ